MLTLVLATSSFACSHSKPVTAPPRVSTVATVPASTPPAAAIAPQVAVSDDVTRVCSLHVDNTATAPKFGYDQFQLLPADRDVLEQVATCLTRGPLKGQSLRLVGHTDPRGTDEYNLALGDRRALAVGEYLMHLGVPTTQLQASTRGELDASGSGEAAWHDDRRVDLTLATR